MSQAEPTDDPGGADGGVRISSDPADLDVDWIHRSLSELAYWALGRSRAQVETSIRNSLCFSAHDDRRQVGFARVVTDQATFAWICDVFVEEAFRGQGVGGRLIEAILGDPRLQGLKRTILATSTAAAYYERYGFAPLEHPERWMERRVLPDRE